MDRKAVIVEWGRVFLRVRKQDDGCIIFDANGTLLEGNNTVWQIMELLANGFMLEGVAAELAGRYQLPVTTLMDDIRELADKLAEHGWERETD